MKIDGINLAARGHDGHKYHRAAIDGYVDMLCDASKRDTNLASEDGGLTPTLLAAQNGQLEALRILVGRGGNPEKSSADGSCALHLAASRNHLNCVSFLVNFGVNMWSLNNELHTAKDVAAMEQHKEVLDYLDQMMAKQSALNTKNVQKLKEKAKLAAEKRIKQLRKIQLKAIKQVERDEKFLIKLSSNRRLLKAAHSISDIKLVGKADHHHHTTATKTKSIHSFDGASNLSSSATSGGRPASAIVGGRLKGAQSIGNLSRLGHYDFLGRILHSNSQASGSNKSTLATAQQRPGISTRLSVNSDMESAYASSTVSSTSDYVSSNGSQLNGKRRPSSRPKYSDLVAMNQDESSRSAGSKTKTRSKETPTAQQSSLKSNSTIATRLRAFGGVSRKVQLKRLLLSGSNSTSDLSIRPDSGANQETSAATDSKQLTSAANTSHPRLTMDSGNESVIQSHRQQQTHSNLSQNNARLCNVQPAIKLKLNSESVSGKQQQVGADGSLGSSIKWPPAPSTLSRAISEPDFSSSHAFRPRQEDVSRSDDQSDQVNDGVASKKDMSGSERRDKEERRIGSKNDSEISNEESRQHHHLLTQCLSQLKMQHQAAVHGYRLDSNNNNASNSDSDWRLTSCFDQKRLEVSQNPKPSATNKLPGVANTRPFGATNSDELIQHQLNAGEVPLRPSIIKQQLQLNHRTVNLNNTAFADATIATSTITTVANTRHPQVPLNKLQPTPGRSVAVVSVDSIGSAGSFVRRNSKSSSSKSLFDSSTSQSSAVSSCNSTASSEYSTCFTQTVVTSQSQQQPPPPPPPPLMQNTAQDYSQRLAGSKFKPMPLWQPSSSHRVDGDDGLERLETFLAQNGLAELSEVFANERIDLEALMLLSEEDLKSLNILLGPRRKLMRAIDNRSRDLRQHRSSNCHQANVKEATDDNRLYLMVDTQL